MPVRLITVVAHAGARVRKLEKVTETSFKAYTNVAPEHGKANADIVDMLGDYFKTKKAAISLIRGTTASKKTFKISLP